MDLDMISLVTLLGALLGTLVTASSLFFYKPRKPKFTVVINGLTFEMQAPANATQKEIETVINAIEKMQGLTEAQPVAK